MAATPMVAMMCCLITSCNYIDDLDTGGVMGASSQALYMQLTLNVDAGATTRAGDNPWGGNTGNTEDNQYKRGEFFWEKQVDDATLFLYDSSKEITENGNIAYALYFKNFSTVQAGGKELLQATIELPKNIDYKKGETFNAVIVANSGEYLGSQIKTISDLRTYHFNKVVDTPYIPSQIMNYRRFVMTSQEISKITINNAGTADDPFIVGTINVQRLAARIDIEPGIRDFICRWNDDDPADSYYEYPVLKQTGSNYEATGDTFKMKRVYLTNSHSSGTWLAQRFAQNADKGSMGDVTYFGKESADKNNQSTNFVVSYNAGETWGQQELYIQYLSDIQDATEGYFDFFIAGYTQENTDRAHPTTLNISGIYRRKTGESTYADSEVTYTYKIRHSDPTGTGNASDLMHYAIVRNSAYYIKIARVVKSDMGQLAIVWYYKNDSGEYVVETTNISPDITTDSETQDGPKTPNDVRTRL